MNEFKSSNRYDVAAQEDRCAPRSRIAMPANFRPAGGRSYQTTVHDLSLGGYCCSSMNRLAPGTICWITLPGLQSLQSEVVWWDNNLVGCAFVDLLSPIIYDNILSRWQPGNNGRGAL